MSDLDTPSDEGLAAGTPNTLLLFEGVYLAEGIFAEPETVADSHFLIIKAQLRENFAPLETAEPHHLCFDIAAGKLMVNQLISAINQHEVISTREADRG